MWIKRARRRALLAASSAMVLFAAQAARAATITVDSTADEDGSTPNGTCTLREAVLAANSDAGVDGCAAGGGPDTISLPAGVYQLSIPGAGEDGALTGDLGVTSTVTIHGAGAASSVVRGGGDRVFLVGLGASLALEGLGVEGGDSDWGGGILSHGVLTLTDCVVSGNRASSAGAGVMVSSAGSASIVRSAVVSNELTGAAGGGIASLGPLAVATSTISANTSLDVLGNGGGGIWNGPTGALTLEGVTFGPNPMIAGQGSALLSAGSVTMANTLFLGVGSCAGDGSWSSLGHNLEYEGTCHLDDASDLVGQLPGASSLQQSGETMVHPLLAGSPALDAADAAHCAATDQRGQPRTGDGDGDGVPACDIGAFELPTSSLFGDLALTLDATPDPVRAGGWVALAANVVNLGPDTVPGVVVELTLPAGAATLLPASCTAGAPVVCLLGSIGYAHGAGVGLQFQAPGTPGTVEVLATVRSDGTDPAPENDSVGRTVTVDPALSPVLISPALPVVRAGDEIQFSASGGTNSGWTWLLELNNSGASIDPVSGLYLAGSVGGTVDTVAVEDSEGNVGRTDVTVDAAASGGGEGCSCAPGGAGNSALLLLPWLGRRRRIRHGR